MEKPFDVKVLLEKLKAVGAPIAEEVAEVVIKEVFDWVEMSAAIHPNAIVKAAVPLAIQVVKPVLAAEINKIDGNPAT